jgi:hypothetical protein
MKVSMLKCNMCRKGGRGLLCNTVSTWPLKDWGNLSSCWDFSPERPQHKAGCRQVYRDVVISTATCSIHLHLHQHHCENLKPCTGLLHLKDDRQMFFTVTSATYSENQRPGSVVGIMTGHGLDGPGIESRWGRDFPHPGAHPASCTSGTGSFPG